MAENSIAEAALIACASLLPEKSKNRYNQAYEVFLKWCAEKIITEIDENVMLAYFLEKSETLSPPTLWSIYSMLKLTISINKNKDICCFKKLIAFLKRKNDGYTVRKSNVFTKEQITKFLLEAPDVRYLAMKAITIMGVAGACRTDEIHKMKLTDLEIKDDIALIKISTTKNGVKRSFVVTNDDGGGIPYVKLLQDYIKLRPENAHQDQRLFYRYERGRCVNQVIGKHIISLVPKEIAKFLKLDNVNKYTGHAFRRTSATLLANTSGADILDLKRHGGWKSSSVAEGYIADSYSNKIDASKKILHQIPTNISSNEVSVREINYKVVQNNMEVPTTISRNNSNDIPSISFNHCSNCSININVNK